MGFWKSKRGICGDSWADEMGRCIRALEKLRVKPIESSVHFPFNVGIDGERGHEITLAEFADLIEFCSRGHIKTEVVFNYGDEDIPLSHLFGNLKVETYPNRGQIHCLELEKI